MDWTGGLTLKIIFKASIHSTPYLTLTPVPCSTFAQASILCVVSATPKLVPLLLAHHLEVCASSGSAQQSVIGRMKWPATYTRYFALGMQLPPTLQ